MPRLIARSAIVLGIALAVSACGFQLRGTGDNSAALPDSWKRMFLVTGNPNGEFSQAVRTVFAGDDVEWTSRDAANYLLVLGPERFNQSNLSLNNEARVSQYELTMQATFSVRDADGREVMPDTTASVVRQMENDPRNAMGKGEELRILRSEMRTQLAQQIVRQIGFFATSNP